MGNLVTIPTQEARSGETVLQRAGRHQEEANALAREAMLGVLTDLEAAAQKCLELRDVQSVPSGVRDAFRRLGDEIQGRHDGILQILARR